MVHLRVTFLFILLLSISAFNSVSAQSISKVEIPLEYRSYSTEEAIKRVLAKPRLTKSRHVFPEDTTIVALAACSGTGLYRFGQGATDHTAGNLVVVVKADDELWYVQNMKSYSQHKSLVKAFWKGKADSTCMPETSLNQLQAKIAQLVEQNKRRVDTSTF
ncbi:hypothetical protein [Hymenobacter persicinus]|uniref:DUF4468 domain-containing protein n=1 Tax=Hymenobacter persicinus TaxID=2025506 RepID=A0A4Q5LAJ0_9BACT|nr:hypothetical protein [Hymenobacter persicinus]RYU78940.1 hypothetical protein EWM57_12210 [Hymenobacter persicinus]